MSYIHPGEVKSTSTKVLDAIAWKLCVATGLALLSYDWFKARKRDLRDMVVAAALMAVLEVEDHCRELCTQRLS